jgi:hypothetical protein
MVLIIWFYLCGNNLDKTDYFIDKGFIPLILYQ